jgi:hypothetical protein
LVQPEHAPAAHSRQAAADLTLSPFHRPLSKAATLRLGRNQSTPAETAASLFSVGSSASARSRAKSRRVLEAIPARCQRLHQCRIGELLDSRLGISQLAVGHHSGDADADLRHASKLSSRNVLAASGSSCR